MLYKISRALNENVNILGLINFIFHFEDIGKRRPTCLLKCLNFVSNVIAIRNFCHFYD